MLRSKKRDATFFELRNNIYMAMTGKSLPKAEPKPAQPEPMPAGPEQVNFVVAAHTNE